MGSLAQSDAKLIPAPPNSTATKTHNLISKFVMLSVSIKFRLQSILKVKWRDKGRILKRDYVKVKHA